MTVGIYPTNPWPELQYIPRHSRSRFVVCGDQEQVDKVLDAASRDGGLPDLERIICVDQKRMRAYDGPRIVPFATVEAVADALPAGEAERRWEQALAAIAPGDICIIVYACVAELGFPAYLGGPFALRAYLGRRGLAGRSIAAV